MLICIDWRSHLRILLRWIKWLIVLLVGRLISLLSYILIVMIIVHLSLLWCHILVLVWYLLLNFWQFLRDKGYWLLILYCCCSRSWLSCSRLCCWFKLWCFNVNWIHCTWRHWYCCEWLRNLHLHLLHLWLHLHLRLSHWIKLIWLIVLIPHLLIHHKWLSNDTWILIILLLKRDRRII